MLPHITVLKRVLRQKGYSLTKPRLVIFLALYNKPPQTMSQLITNCQMNINRATVYRVTNLFEQLGITNRLSAGWKYKLELSDQFGSHHHHATCTSCGSVIILTENNELEAFLEIWTAQAGFTMFDHQVELRGICQNCQA